ncbi:hypothetical protein AgCh_020505 [Apium graveolens]
MVGEQGSGMAEKAMVVLSSLAGTEGGKSEIVEVGGIPAFLEAIEDGPMKEIEFAVLSCFSCVVIMLQLLSIRMVSWQSSNKILQKWVKWKPDLLAQLKNLIHVLSLFRVAKDSCQIS